MNYLAKVSNMFRLFAIIIFISFNIIASAQGDENIRTLNIGDSIELEAKDNGAIFEFHKTKIKFSTIKKAEDNWISEVSIQIQREDEEPLIVVSEANDWAFANISLYIFEPNRTPTIMFQSFSGGAHCCAIVNLVDLGKEQLKVENLGFFDGDFLYPTDIDGDGIVEIVTYDNAFLYSFDSYANSLPPRQIFSFNNGQPYDASFERRFDRIFLEEYDEAKAACLENEEGLSAGLCAGYLAIAARVGKYKKAKNLVLKAIREGREINSIWEEFQFCKDDECKEQVTFTKFFPALEYALKRWGYIKKK